MHELGMRLVYLHTPIVGDHMTILVYSLHDEQRTSSKYSLHSSGPDNDST